MLLRYITVLVLAAASQAQTYPPPFPREGAKKLFENDRVAVWDVVWPKGQPSPIHQHRYDQLSVTLVGGTVRVTRLDGTSTVNQSELGSVTLTAKGTVHQEEGLSETPQHKIMVELKSAAAALPSKDNIPAAFPREGAVKLMENDRVIAWDYTWKPGRVVPPHTDYQDMVSVFLEGGALAAPPDGGNSAVIRTTGQVIFTPASAQASSEEAVRGMPRAVILELK
jgi:quercetin dioxygenase-like cupin family protein